MIYQEVKSQIELEINLTIGHKKYFLQVQKNACLTSVINQFLCVHELNPKYQRPILALVRKELEKRQETISQQSVEDRTQQNIIKKDHNKTSKHKNFDTFQSNSSYDNQYETNEKDKQQNNYNRYKQNLGSVQNIIKKQQLQPESEKTSKSMSIYENWKTKEKQKEKGIGKGKTNQTITTLESQSIRKMQSKSKNKNKSPVAACKTPKKILQIHQPSYFYRKGLAFENAKQIHHDELFKKQYPFSTKRDISITPTKKNQLHQRLYHDSKVKEGQRISERNQECLKNMLTDKPHNKVDHIKQKIQQKNEKVDKALEILLKNGMIENPYKIQKVSKSPFRKTNLN